MGYYYDITILNDIGGSISYWADSFSVDEHRILRVYSRDCGNVVVQLQCDEVLTVQGVIVPDEY